MVRWPCLFQAQLSLGRLSAVTGALLQTLWCSSFIPPLASARGNFWQLCKGGEREDVSWESRHLCCQSPSVVVFTCFSLIESHTITKKHYSSGVKNFASMLLNPDKACGTSQETDPEADSRWIDAAMRGDP